jgi:hypothetical protein
MVPAGDSEGRGAEDVDRLHEIVPARAVLTELARGFLLVHDSNPDRAVRFAETFLRERAGTVAPARVEGARNVTLARLRLGRSGSGVVEPSGFPSGR